MLYHGTFTNQRFITSATEPAVPYISSSVPFNLNVGVTPMRKFLDVIGRETPSHLTLKRTVASKQLAIMSFEFSENLNAQGIAFCACS